CVIDRLEVVKDEIIYGDDNQWHFDDKAGVIVQCPECSDRLDTTDLSILGVPADIIKKVTSSS
ncbi:unnamed protein product, partial [marine sediment metagenome]